MHLTNANSLSRETEEKSPCSLFTHNNLRVVKGHLLTVLGTTYRTGNVWDESSSTCRNFPDQEEGKKKFKAEETAETWKINVFKGWRNCQSFWKGFWTGESDKWRVKERIKEEEILERYDGRTWVWFHVSWDWGIFYVEMDTRQAARLRNAGKRNQGWIQSAGNREHRGEVTSWMWIRKQQLREWRQSLHRQWLSGSCTWNRTVTVIWVRMYF